MSDDVTTFARTLRVLSLNWPLLSSLPARSAGHSLLLVIVHVFAPVVLVSDEAPCGAL